MTSAATQHTLMDFTQPQTARLIPTYRKNSSDTYEVRKLGQNEYSCLNAITQEPCQGHKRNGRCSHVAEFEISELKERLHNALRSNEYFQTRFERELKQRFQSFQAFYDWAWQGEGEAETVYLSKLFLALLFMADDHRGTTDLIHFAVNEKFSGNPKKIGNCTKRLEAAGLIRPVLKGNGEIWRIKSARENINHGSMKVVYELTDKGAGLIEAVT